MANAVIVTAQLPQAEAQALLEALREQYRLRLNEYWYDDQYRFVADGQPRLGVRSIGAERERWLSGVSELRDGDWLPVPFAGH
ncbi:hypothetical protein RYA07_15470 [Pseudomonas syringae pv. actinidiae]|uniref:hypothetical protein n=1 Tax=Pseudomonas syringae TaxID=317 RepID=UPI0002DB0266|nr:hypothetical protein [Pseudomonas syringae]MDU8489799.1 hypothetical protein [Pseudomonas syringae pv. actinidiae]NVL23067.1 hypothetical protein [Pseudomonas syringae pv. actinidiae]NVL25961.1 hypothetical protein [Pseudomonas syringae pv. actinidiae]NVL32471.1 hypothetical protein [Pseudomonas syringae pv. actinidiae]NVL40317.1 hypothetical protein [Pseudomonas syringae pv. actinidiae]